MRWDGTDKDAQKPNIASPLYDIAFSKKTEDGIEAGVTNIRHLQNLDASVSDVGDEITGAKLFKDLDWSGGIWDDSDTRIYIGDKRDDGSYYYATSFYGITNENLKSFDGQGHTLSNFVIDRASGSDNAPPDDNADAGLFRKLTGDAKDLNLEGFTVEAGSDGNAGVLAANAQKSENVESVNVEGVFVNTNNASVTADKYAGGLIGYAEGPISVDSCASYSKGFAKDGEDGKPGSVTAGGNGVDGVAGGLIGAIKGADGSTVKNCASANIVTANGADGVAGGLIGQASGDVEVSYSYAGGVTVDGGSYERKDNALNGNVTGAYAGGLIGQAADNSAVTLENAYSAASVHGGKAADNVYTASGSANVQTDGVYGAGEYQQGNGPIRTGTPERLTNPTADGKPYDAELPSAYPYKSLQDMDASLKNSGYEWLSNHVGDWPVIPDLHPQIKLHNEEILYVEVYLDDCAYKSADLEIKSLTNPNLSVKIPFPFDPDTGDFTPDASAPQRVYPKTDDSGKLVRNDKGKIYYVVTPVSKFLRQSK